MQRSRFHNHDDTSQKPVESSILFGKVPTYSRETFQAKVLLDFDVRIILVSLGLILWYYPQADDAGQCAPQTCTFEKMLEFHWIPIEIMWNHVMFCQKYASDTRKIQCTRPRDSSTALNGRLFSWSEGLKAWNMVMCECLPTSFSTILDYSRLLVLLSELFFHVKRKPTSELYFVRCFVQWISMFN